MKNLVLLTLLSIAISSCTKNDPIDSTSSTQLWELVKMTGQIPNSETTGDDMEWQELYTLNADLTFIKQRDRDGVTTEASGTYQSIEVEGENLIEFNFETDSKIIGNCLGNQTETLRLINSELLVGTWLACDGPGLEYKRKE